MKKLLSLFLSLLIILSVVTSLSVPVLADTKVLSDKLTDTSDFALSSIELTEQMLIGYNIGNCFEMTELRPAYVRPKFDSIDEHIAYKETMAGNVQITEEYIKYLKSIGIQAIRLPITWFNMLEDENGNIYSKDTWYADIETRRNAWYNGKINEEFLARIKQVVDWIIENDMYCIINTHHDAAANTSNAVNPIKMEEVYKEQTYNYLTNIWSQVGEYFKDYGSKLIFEFYNEATSNSGHMTANSTTDAFVSDLLCHLIPLIRNQGSNNANRFLVCPRYGGVSYWLDDEHFAKFRASDTSEDKIIITTHTYETSSQMYNSVKSVRTRMNSSGVGAIIGEIGNTYASNLSEEMIKMNTQIRKASDEYKVSCFWWDGGLIEASLTNRYYSKPSNASLAAYVGKEVEYKTYTKDEIVEIGALSNQPNWVKLETPDYNSAWGKKYTIITTESKINTLKAATSTKSRGYYTLDCEEEGLTTVYVSDDDKNYYLVSTVIPTNWCMVAWNEFNIGGTTYYTKQIAGNYSIQKIGDGLQNYVQVGDDLLQLGGNWKTGAYSISNGNYESNSMRICLENKIEVRPNTYYNFFISSTNSIAQRYPLILRVYKEDGSFLKSIGAINNTKIKMPDDGYYLSVSMYDTYQSQNAQTLLGLIEDGTLTPSMHLFIPQEETECSHEPLASLDKVVPPTCAEQGYTEHTCAKCGQVYQTDVTQATGNHTSVVDKGYDATCTATGLTDGAHCDVCQKVLVVQTTIEKKPHTTVTDKGYDATCTEEGLTYGSHCDVCKTVLVAQQPIKATGHTEKVTQKGIAPTCTLPGIADEIYCAVCDVKLQERTFIPAKGHELTDEITKQPTCGKAGVRTYSCDCGYSYTEEISATGEHKYVWTVTKKATYFAKGTKSYKCSCGKVAKTESIAQLKLKKPTVTYKAMAKKISVKYTKVTGATGFQVRYRLTSSKSWKTVNFKTSKSATKYIKNLKKNKKYYLQTRAYVQSGSKKAYSSWTTRKTIKVK